MKARSVRPIDGSSQRPGCQLLQRRGAACNAASRVRSTGSRERPRDRLQRLRRPSRGLEARRLRPRAARARDAGRSRRRRRRGPAAEGAARAAGGRGRGQAARAAARPAPVPLEELVDGMRVENERGEFFLVETAVPPRGAPRRRAALARPRDRARHGRRPHRRAGARGLRPARARSSSTPRRPASPAARAPPPS